MLFIVSVILALFEILLIIAVTLLEDKSLVKRLEMFISAMLDK